jgi:tetratricopeptide (TPR) repeat protein
LFFALHPVQVEPVAWVTGMKDLLCAFFAFVAIWQYLLYAKARTVSPPVVTSNAVLKTVPGTCRRRFHYALGLGAFLLALLAKPAAVVVPLIAWALDRWVLGRAGRRSLAALGTWLALAALFIAVTQLVQPDSGAKFVTPLWARPLVAGDALAFYLWSLFWPLDLAPDYGRAPEWLLRQSWAYLIWVIPAGIVGVVWCRQRRWPLLAASVAVFTAGVLPVLGLSPFDFQRISTVADRYLYLSMLGPALSIAWLIRERLTVAAGAAAVIVLGVLAVASAVQLRHWRDDRSLFSYALKVNPNSWTAHNNLGNAELREGNLRGAVGHFRRALEIDPGYAKAHNNLGIVQVMGGQVEEAIHHYRRALEIDPGYAKAHNNLGIALAMRGELDEAISHFQQALEAHPAFVEAHYNMANMLARKGQLRPAIAHYRRVLEIDPGNAKAHNNLGIALAMQGELNDAVGHFRQALGNEPESPEIHERLARALSLQGNQEEASKHYEEAIRILKARKSGTK